MNEIVKCKKCGSMPTIVRLQGLYYAQCTGICGRWEPHEHLGVTEAAAINNWNKANLGLRNENGYIE